MQHLFDRTDEKVLLLSRQVCKSWNQGILDFMKNHPSQRPITKHDQDSMGTFYAPNKMKILPIQLKTAKEFRKFIKKMKPSASPLPGNAIEVNLGYKDDLLEYIFQGNRWFEIFGEHVLYVTFNLQVSTNNLLVAYATIRDWVNACPNIRLFSIKGTFTETTRMSERIMQTLEAQISVFSLDFGPYIETLQYDFQNLPKLMNDEIFRALERSVKKLYFRLDQWTKKTDLMFTQVTDLEISGIISIVILNDFLKSCFPSNVSFLNLKLNLQVTLDWTDILIILRHLRVNSLELHDSSDGTKNIPTLTNLFRSRLKVESLTQLSIFDNLGLTFDFLINFPSLKYLQVSPVCLKSNNIEQFKLFVAAPGTRQLDITIRGALYNNTKPNFHLWLTLPSLKKFLVKRFVNEKQVIITYNRDISIQRRTRILFVSR